MTDLPLNETALQAAENALMTMHRPGCVLGSLAKSIAREAISTYLAEAGFEVQHNHIQPGELDGAEVVGITPIEERSELYQRTVGPWISVTVEKED